LSDFNPAFMRRVEILYSQGALKVTRINKEGAAAF
jgi:hypothetical protein